jgi:hypothetical protein
MKNVSDIVKPLIDLLIGNSLKATKGTYTYEDELKKLSIIVNDKWVGATLEVVAKNGEQFGYTIDTDNYRLDFNLKALEEIVNEIAVLTQYCIDKKLAIADVNNEQVLIYPVSDNFYEYTAKIKWRFYKKIRITKTDLDKIQPKYYI